MTDAYQATYDTLQYIEEHLPAEVRRSKQATDWIRHLRVRLELEANRERVRLKPRPVVVQSIVKCDDGLTVRRCIFAGIILGIAFPIAYAGLLVVWAMFGWHP